MYDERLMALLTELDAEQTARARLYLHLNLLADVGDVAAFADALADVATARSRAGKHAPEWARLAEALEGFLRPGPQPSRGSAAVATSAPASRAEKAPRSRGIGERRPKFD